VNVQFCGECRRLILSDFRFCPYCGASVPRGPELAEALAGPLDALGDAHPPARADVFASARTSLDRLESDMDLILEELEREGRSQT
jgi:hypothetical protein